MVRRELDTQIYSDWDIQMAFLFCLCGGVCGCVCVCSKEVIAEKLLSKQRNVQVQLSPLHIFTDNCCEPTNEETLLSKLYC